MNGPGENTVLQGLLDEAEMSNTGLAAAVVAAGSREGIHLGTSTTTVKRMLEGSQPHWPVPRLVAAVLSGRLQREISITECGFVDVRHEALSTNLEVRGLRRCYVAP